MKMNKFKLLTVTAAAAAALAMAPNAMACDRCLPDDNHGGEVCWSGFDEGSYGCSLVGDTSGTNSCVWSGGYCSNNDSAANEVAWEEYYGWDGGWWTYS